MRCWTRLAVAPGNKSAKKRRPCVLMATKSQPFGLLTLQLKIAADRKTARLRVEPLSDAQCRKIVVHLAGWAGDKKDAVIELDPKSRSNLAIPLAPDSSAPT